MIVSWNWLKEYVRLDMPVETLGERLMMSGLNLEQISEVDGDLAIDLEVTSNRPDCLGHLGIAREAAALFGSEWKFPPAEPLERGPDVANFASVAITAPELCPRYIARLIRNVQVSPSPLWMQRRLKTLGLRPVNNIVDITNYVLMECGQPLHAFDFDKLHGKKIIVRTSQAGEKIAAIDQKLYELRAGLCVIADAERPVAVAGVMGGLETEIGAHTVNVLIEAAEFAPVAVRHTARQLNLHSDSSYRFERGIDPYTLDWASRRCCQLILELAGGELCAGAIAAGQSAPPPRTSVSLRLAQIPRVLGIEIPEQETVRILTTLGLRQQPNSTAETLAFIPPTWRRDLTREIDLVEEVARIHGYENIPEDVPVPLAVSQTTLEDRVRERVTGVLTGAGFYEAYTLTFVSEEQSALFSPWSAGIPLRVEHSSRQRENVLRQSLIPSLLACRRQNERHGAYNTRLFEFARIFLSAEPSQPSAQPRVVSLVTGQSFAELKGIVTAVAQGVNRTAEITAVPATLPQFAPGRGAELRLNGERWGYLGELAEGTQRALDLRDAVAVAELDLHRLEQIADLSPSFVPFPEHPLVERDLNFLLEESVTWQELSDVIRAAAGTLLETASFVSQYRGQQIAANKKSYVVRLQYRAADRTLTAAEVDAAQHAVIAACQAKLAAVLR